MKISDIPCTPHNCMRKHVEGELKARIAELEVEVERLREMLSQPDTAAMLADASAVAARAGRPGLSRCLEVMAQKYQRRFVERTQSFGGTADKGE